MKVTSRYAFTLLSLLLIFSHFSCQKNKNVIEINENKIIRLTDVANDHSKLIIKEQKKRMERGWMCYDLLPASEYAEVIETKRDGVGVWVNHSVGNYV